MKNNFIGLFNKFAKIKKMGWIKTMRNGTTGVGFTFESLLNKEENSLQIPDYGDIEIKTMKYFSKNKIHLFNATPDGNSLYPIKRVLNNLGYPDKDYPEFKVFNVSVNADKSTNLRNKQIKLYVNREKEIIELKAYDIIGKEIDLDVSWSFEMLKQILNIKLNKLAIVKACSKKINNEDYYLYSTIDFYCLREFDTFIDLIEKGIITITFKIGICKDKENLGKIHDRGTDFSIMEKDIPLLFEKYNF